jgi:hypothetical protein
VVVPHKERSRFSYLMLWQALCACHHPWLLHCLQLSSFRFLAHNQQILSEQIILCKSHAWTIISSCSFICCSCLQETHDANRILAIKSQKHPFFLISYKTCSFVSDRHSLYQRKKPDRHSSSWPARLACIAPFLFLRKACIAYHSPVPRAWTQLPFLASPPLYY